MTDIAEHPVELARRAAVQPGRVLAVPVPHGACRVEILLLEHAGQLRAWLNSCPHTGVSLNFRPDDFFDDSGRYLRCTMHGALFRPEDGHCVAGPCAGAGLVRVPVIERDGAIWLAAPGRLPATARA